MSLARVLLLAITLISTNPAFADRARYGGKKELTSPSPEFFSVEHAGQPELIKLRDPEGTGMSIPFQLTPPPSLSGH